MVDRKVHIIAIQERYLDTITKQVKEVLGDKLDIQSTTVKDLQSNTVGNGDTVVISNNSIKWLVTQLIPKDCPCIIAKRDINYTNTRELLNLPAGQKILVVNDNKSNAEETVQSLRETIFEHTYIAYSPEEPMPETIDYIVTPGERQLLPQGLNKVIDIGPRLLDIRTFEELIKLLEIDYQQTQLVKRYFKAWVSLSGNYDIKKQKKLNSTRDIRNVAQYRFSDIVAVSEAMKEAVTLAKSFSTTNSVIHIEGEPGTGKNMLAQAIHNYSNLSGGPFITINCASRDFEKLEKELFGSEDGEGISTGIFELAKNGTICIKEIGELPYSLQGQICRVIEEGKFSRLAGYESITLQARIITTSTKNCKKLIDDGLLRQDLYYLLSTFSLKVPSLYERKEDFLPLIEDIKYRIKRSDILFTSEVIDYLTTYEWKGNVKELYNVITYLSFLEEEKIEIQSLPFHLRPKEEEQKFNQIVNSDINLNGLITKIEEHGFLDESVEILRVFYEGKKEHTSFGRLALKKCLQDKGTILTEQQLRIRLEVLQNLDLILVRQGRAGSTISRQGEKFLKNFL